MTVKIVFVRQLLTHKPGACQCARSISGCHCWAVSTSRGGSRCLPIPLARTAKWAEGPAVPQTRSGMQIKSSVNINSQFDSGNIELVNVSNPEDLQLRIRPDPLCEKEGRNFFQWFHFRLTGAKDKPVTIRILNAGQASFPGGWPGYACAASYDRQYWFRTETTYDSATGHLTITHTPSQGSIYFAYWAPYSYERHQDLVAALTMHPFVHYERLGQTLDGHDIDLLKIGDDSPGKRKVWVIARQHPGEAMAEWFAEGLLRRLVDEHDAISRSALRQAVFYVVPNMNPDGSWRGHLRTNVAGANLNREWVDATLERSPEVLHVRSKMEETGVDMMMDVHGDEALPYNFVAGNEGIPAWDQRLAGLQDRFCEALLKASPDFQTEHGYSVDAPGQANMTTAASAVGQKFNCLSFTLEQPFKDTANAPESVCGWSPARASRFGGASLSAIHEVLPHLR